MKLSPESTQYLRSDIESNQLRSENVIPLIMGLNVSSSSTAPVQLRTTGNGVIYLEGTAVMTSGVIAGDAIARVPPEYALPATQTDRRWVHSATNAGVSVGQLQWDGDAFITLSGYAASERIYFDGIMYVLP